MRTILYTLRIGCVALLLGQTSQAMAVDCDCTQLAGSCSASYELRDIRNQPKNSAATLVLRSSHATCSKITFFIDNTPHITVLKSGNSSTESLFGTSTIEQNTVSIESCRVCAKSGQAKREARPPDLSPETAHFQNAMRDPTFDSTHTDVAFQNASAQGRGSDQFFNSVTQGLSSAISELGKMSAQQQAEQSQIQPQGKSQCWYSYSPEGKRRYSHFPCHTGWYGCEGGPGPNDKMC